MLEVTVAADEQEERAGKRIEAAEENMVSPQLRRLGLRDLPELNPFLMGNFSFEWPSLEEVTVRECPKMKTFACDEIQTTPKLREIKVKYGEFIEGISDLNVNMTIQKRFKEKGSEAELMKFSAKN